jgi:hypothetical protein
MPILPFDLYARAGAKVDLNGLGISLKIGGHIVSIA